MTALPLELPGLATPAAPPVAAHAAPELVYESEHVTVYHGQAEDLLPALPKETFDLILTDPPYGVEWQSNRRAEKFDPLDNDSGADRGVVRSVLEQCVRLVRQHRHLYVFGPTDVLDGLKVSEPVSLVWDKMTMGSGDVTAAWGPSHEPISFCVSKFRHAGDAGKPTVPARLRKGTVISVPRPTGRKVRHPSEKPTPLLRELIESSSRQGETILDPFGGVLSTAVAAILTNRRAVVVEKKAQYVEVGVERIKAAEKAMENVRFL